MNEEAEGGIGGPDEKKKKRKTAKCRVIIIL